jgi:hypothetical protein
MDPADPILDAQAGRYASRLGRAVAQASGLPYRNRPGCQGRPLPEQRPYLRQGLVQLGGVFATDPGVVESATALCRRMVQ